MLQFTTIRCHFLVSKQLDRSTVHRRGRNSSFLLHLARSVSMRIPRRAYGPTSRRREWSQCPAPLAAAQHFPRAPWPWLWVCLRSHGTPQNRLLLSAQDSEPGEEGALVGTVVLMSGGTARRRARACEHGLGRIKDSVDFSRFLGANLLWFDR